MDKKLLLIIAVASIFVAFANCHTKDEWKSRTIYQILTDRFARSNGDTSGCDISKYCGGTWRGIINNLNYIQGMGFDAIWISPIISNIDGGYHGYWGKDLYSLNSNFGSESDFNDLVNECHSRDIWVMVDVVGNHVGPVNTDYSQISPFNSGDHYHDYCIIESGDFANNQWRVENCRLAGLPDLKHENSYVTQTLLDWIKNLVAKYNIDGIRIDTVPEVPKTFWSQFSAASGVYSLGEVFDGRFSYSAGYQGSVDGVLAYPFYYQTKNCFAYGHPMSEFENYYQQASVYKDLSVLGIFADNHDNARFLSQNSNRVLFKSYIGFTLTAIGIPIIYYGSEQSFSGGNDPNNREVIWNSFNQGSDIYQLIKNVLTVRKSLAFWKEPQVQRYSDAQFYAFTRGKVLMAFTNVASGGVQRTITYHPFSNGTKICNIFFPTTDCITVNGGINVYLLNGEFKIYIVSGAQEKAFMQ